MKHLPRPATPTSATKKFVFPRAFWGAALAAVICVVPSGLHAADWVPTATGTYSWNSDSNWSSPATFPNALGAVASVSGDLAGGNQIINLNQAITIGSLTIGDTGTGTDNNYTIQAGAGGSLIFDNGASAATVTTSGSVTADIISAPVTIGANGLVVNTTSVSTNPVLSLNGTLSGGNLTKTGSARMALGGNNTGWSGTLTVQQGFVITTAANALTASNAVVVNTGATFDANTAGALTVGSLAGNGRAVLHGGGLSLNVGGGANVANTITVDGASAFLSPGDSTDPTGTLTLEKINSGGINVALTTGSLVLDIVGESDFDSLAILSVTDASVLTIDSAFNLTLNLGYAPTVGDSFTIVAIDGATGISGQFAQGTLVSGVYNSTTYDFSVNYSGGTGNDIVLTALVPEPATSALCIVAVIGLFAGRRPIRCSRQS